MIILFEGIDGSGKTTTARMLESVLKRKYNIKYVREPGNSFLGELSRFLLKKGDYNNETNMLLYLLSRSANIKTIRKMSQNHIILLDRFTPSTIAYQGMYFNNYELIYNFEKLIRKNVVPTYTFHLECTDVNTYIQRQEKRDKLKYNESTKQNLAEYYKYLVEGYEKAYELLNYNNLYRINADDPIVKNAKQIYTLIKDELPNYKR